MDCKDCPMFKTKECIICRQQQEWEKEFYHEVELDIQEEIERLNKE